MHKYETAHKHLSRSLALCPDGELTTGNMGICLFEMARYDEAFGYLADVVCNAKRRVDLEHPDVGPRCLECYAVILFREKKEYTESVRILKRLLKHKEFENGKQSHRKDVIYSQISKVYAKSKDFERALKYLKKAKKHSPGKAEYEEQIKRMKASMNSIKSIAAMEKKESVESIGSEQ